MDEFNGFGGYGFNDMSDNGYYGDDYGMGMDDYSGMYPNYGPYKPLKATTRNVQDVISEMLGCYPQELKFTKLDELPMSRWMHSCYMSGVTEMNVNQFVFDDGSTVTYAVCPFFPQCNVVHYHVDRAGLGY